jgi:transcription elongation factor Elf1
MKNSPVNFECPVCSALIPATMQQAAAGLKCEKCGTGFVPDKPFEEPPSEIIKEPPPLTPQQLDEENAKAVAWEGRSVKRICPHCGNEATWKVTVKPGIKTTVVRCSWFSCNKTFTIVDPSDDLITPLADMVDQVKRVKFLIGVLVFFMVLLPLICWAIIESLHK